MDKLNRCFQGSKGISPRLIRKDPSINAAEAHLEKAEGNLLAMESMFRNKHLDWTIIASYYAMYHATLSSLWLIGVDARSHECALLAFETFYAKKGKLDSKYVEYVHRAKNLSEKYAETLEQIRTLRVQASYGIGEVKSADAELSRAAAKEFVAAIRAIVYEAKGFGYTKL